MPKLRRFSRPQSRQVLGRLPDLLEPSSVVLPLLNGVEAADRLAEAVGDLRFTEDVLDAFSRIDGVSTQTHCSPFGRRGLGTFSTPAVRIRGFQFTGSAARLSGARPM